MKRFPNGVTGKAFYQQKAPADAPASVRVETVADEGLTTADRLIGGDLATLLYLVQLGAISVDPWHSRVAVDPDSPTTRSSISIPGPRAPFARVVEVALRGEGGARRVRPARGAEDVGRERDAHRAAAAGRRSERRRANDRRARRDARRRALSEDRDDRAVGEVARGRRGLRRLSSEHSRKNRGRCLFRSRAADGDRFDAARRGARSRTISIRPRSRSTPCRSACASVGDLWGKGMKTPEQTRAVDRGSASTWLSRGAVRRRRDDALTRFLAYLGRDRARAHAARRDGASRRCCESARRRTCRAKCAKSCCCSRARRARACARRCSFSAFSIG